MTTIDRNGDLTIRVIEYDEHARGSDGQRLIHQTGEFLVSRKVLTDGSSYFEGMFRRNNFTEAAQTVVELCGHRVKTMEIWFLLLHGSSLDAAYRSEHEFALATTYTVKLEEIWYLVDACDYFQFGIQLAWKWFEEWYKQHAEAARKDPQKFLYPTWRFNHAEGFAAATRTLAYGGIGHVMEENPTKLYQFHLPPRIIQQLNAAKGRLRTVLLNGLFAPNETLLSGACQCKAETLFGYEKALYLLPVWPLERAAQRTSMGKILDRLEKFSYTPPEAKSCWRCRLNFEEMVKDARQYTRDYFDGLCLTCLDRSQAKTRDSDEDYWKHKDMPEDAWIEGCRFRHRQPTWYFSFMGRKEDRDRFRPRKRSSRHFDNDSD